MLGVTFGNKHSYNDWGIWLEDSHKNPPLPKRYIVDVPARNGLLELTPELTPIIRFENRTLTFTFRVKAGNWSSIESMIYGDVHGKTLDVVSDLDPNWHWRGCVTVDDFASDERTGVIVITVDAYPFKLSNTENSYTVNGDGTITCVVDRMEISPAFDLTAPTTVIYGDSSYVIESTATTEKTLSGDIVSFADGTANPAVDLTADIDAVQDLHGYDHPWVGGAGKNLLAKASSTELHGITATVADDGTITLNGTTTGTSFIRGNVTLDDTSVQYAFSAFNPTAIQSAVEFSLREANDGIAGGWNQLNSENKTHVFTPEAGKIPAKWRLQINSGITFSNYVVKPMLVKGSTPATTYEPYTNICPISGWDEVNVNVVGKNLYIGSPSFDGYVNRNGYALASEMYNGHEVIQRSSAWNGAYKEVPVLAGKTYTFSSMVKVSATVNVSIYNANNDRLLYQSVPANTWTRIQATFTASEDKLEHLRVEIGIANTTIYLSEYQLELGSATAYEPYNGQTYTIDLDGTRYGGTLDVTTGVLTVTRALVDLGTLNWTKQTDVSWNCFSSSVVDKNKSGTVICSNYPQGAIYGTSTDKIVGVNANSNNIYVRDSSYMSGDASAFKTAMSGVQLVYELATPQVVQLTPTQVTTLLGQNNIWADSGEIEELTYRISNVQ